MNTTAPLPEAPARPDEEGEEDRSSRKLLLILLWILGIAALALLALLLWLLWPKGGAPSGEAAGYPIEVVTTIYGYGEGADERLVTPLGVAFDGQGSVWISNTGQSRVEQYTTDGAFQRAVGTGEDAGKLYSPYGLAVDQNTDRVYVADYGGSAVQIYTTSGAYVGHFPADDQPLKVFGDGFTPYDVEVVDGRVVVASSDGLYFFDSEGHVVGQWVGKAKGKNVRGPNFGQFNFPDTFAVNRETGTYYIADTLNRRIVAIEGSGRWSWVSGSSDTGGEITGFWQLPRGIEVGPDGNIYVVDTFRPDGKGMGAGHIVVLSPDGDLLSEFGRAGSEDGAFSYPEQLAFDRNDLWAIADRENNRVVIFRLKPEYPDPTEIEASKYVGMISNPANTWSTSKKDRQVSPSPSP